MLTSTSPKRRNKRSHVPRVLGFRSGQYTAQSLLDAAEAETKAKGHKVTYSEVLRRITEEWLRREGYPIG